MATETNHTRGTVMRNHNIRTVDVSDWAEYEKPDMSTPYEVIASPYGETVARSFATEAEARTQADHVRGLTGTYLTSWGEVPVNTEVTITHYVDNSDAPSVVAPGGRDDLEELREDDEISPVPSYSFYVGSTPTHDAHHNAPHAADAFPIDLAREVYNGRILTYGVWDGETEATAIYETRLPDDATAQRIAYALAILTGNDCVMVTRDAFKGESDRAMTSTARYRVSEVTTREGNRTLYQIDPDADDNLGYRFERDVKGDEIAYLVHSDASVTPVS